MDRGDGFKGRQFTAEVILWAVRWYLMFSHRLPRSRTDAPRPRRRGRPHNDLSVGSRPIAEELEKRIHRPHLRMSNGSWRVDETYVRVKGRWMYLYRAVDSRGQTVDFLLAARRDTAAAKRFFTARRSRSRTPSIRARSRSTKNPAYPRAVAEMKRDSELWRRNSRLRQCKYLNTYCRAGSSAHQASGPTCRLGFGGFRTARRTLRRVSKAASDDDPEGADSKDRRTRYPRTRRDLHYRSFRYRCIKEIGSSFIPVLPASSAIVFATEPSSRRRPEGTKASFFG